eukprot:CAMPEP_0179429904 /NCGR_PEP_ID=MMETSP0799-20121207/15168_1 /TAXON_ID=46947 /ORGANISM="Geminigera cryophila, Strain CCMP2564" /LENGTH=215 /DNA_ID=CAMNT_0021206049 /DNA_START=246 /DNA_END=893 /DNA_ORIENTATION=-
MAPDVFADMQECLANHPLTGGAVLGQTAFAKTRGFVIAFNREGIEQFKHDVRFECLYPYFERAVLEEANAWVLNLLICHEPTYASDVVVRLHLDDTLRTHWIFHSWLAHQVNVLYVTVPQDMMGGWLQVWNYNRKPSQKRTHDMNSPDHTVTPEENTMIAFRGDSFHRVMGYTTRTNTKRISLVLEQYQVAALFYPFTETFGFYRKDDMDVSEMM